MLETIIKSLLEDNGNITDLVGDRIYPLDGDEGAVEPYIVWQIISAPRDHTMDGVLSLVKARIQITCWANDYLTAANIKETVRVALDNFSDFNDPSIADVIIQRIHYEDENDIMDFTAGVDESKRFGKQMDFFIWFNE